MHDMKTFEGRKAVLHETLADPTFALDTKEQIRHAYYWVMFEYSRIKKQRWHRRQHKYMRLLNEDLAAFRFRRDTTNHL